MGLPSAGATAGIAATSYGVAGAIAINLAWHYATQTPPVDVPTAVSDSWVLIIGATLQAIGHAVHWYINRNAATGAAVILTPVK